jgi:hypothetical protein
MWRGIVAGASSYGYEVFDEDLYRLYPLALELSLKKIVVDQVSHKWSDYSKSFEVAASETTTLIPEDVPLAPAGGGVVYPFSVCSRGS